MKPVIVFIIKRLLFSIAVLLTVSEQSYAQKQFNNWLFGYYAGMTFNTSPPTAILTGATYTNEGVASISDPITGSLLFYTDGVTVWNRNNQPMPSGTGLLGHSSAEQSALAIRSLVDTSIYYLFTVDQAGYYSPTRGFNYSIIDMRQDGGLGDVVCKNIHVLDSASEALTAIPRTDQKAYWIIVHTLNNNDFYAYTLSDTGISSTAVISSVGTPIGTGDYGICGISSSPDGEHIALSASYFPLFELFDFDPSSGIVSNPVTLPISDRGMPPSYPSPSYLSAFSPDGSFLYIDDVKNDSTAAQFDITSGDPIKIANSKIMLDTVATYDAEVSRAFMEAPDGKIYLSTATENWLGVIEDPNVRGVGAQYEDDGFDLMSGNSFLGLPNIPAPLLGKNWLTDLSSGSSNIVIRPSTLFANDTIECDSVTFGVSIHGVGCSPASALNFSIAGQDSSSYRLGSFKLDSISVTLISQANGLHRAFLVIGLTDGLFDTVSLGGYVSRQQNALVFTPNTLFSGDTIYCDSILRTLGIRSIGCVPPSMSTISIIGRDSAAFQYSRTSPDSISVMLVPYDTGAMNAYMLVGVSDGSTDTIPLNGFRSMQGGSVLISPNVLFTTDTLHCDSITRSVTIHASGCEPPSLSGWSITGRDSESYIAGLQNNDTLSFTLIPRNEGPQQAFVVMQFSNGTQDTVSLLGVNAPARTLAINTNPIDLGTVQPCESRDTVIAYTNMSCVPVIFNGWSMAHYGDGFQVYNINYQPITIPAYLTDSLHITFDGSQTGAVYDTVVLIVGTDADSVRRIPVQTYVPAIDTVNFLLSMPAQLSAGEHFAANILPDRAVSGKGLVSVSGLLSWTTNDFDFDSITAPSNLTLVNNSPYIANGNMRVAFAVSNLSGITLDPTKPIAKLWLQADLTDTTNFSISLDSVMLNSGDANYSQCILATGGAGTNASLLQGCGDSLLISTVDGKPILLIAPPHPNPATNEVTINFINPLSSPISYEVIDALGATRLRGVTGEDALTLDVSSLAEGVYFFQAFTSGGVSASREILVLR